MRPHDEFPQVLRLYLMSAGVVGKKESEIIKRFKHRPQLEVIAELEALWADHKAQRFTIDSKTRVWRATDLANV